MKSKPLNTLLNKNNRLLSNILEKVQLLDRVNTKVKILLPDELKDHCSVANLRQGVLVLQVANAAMATRVRYQSPELLSVLRRSQHLPGLVAIECIVRISR